MHATIVASRTPEGDGRPRDQAVGHDANEAVGGKQHPDPDDADAEGLRAYGKHDIDERVAHQHDRQRRSGQGRRAERRRRRWSVVG